ncbi:hypothetical protein TRFO_14339 [Tritrichomonas foetus]|uniref:NAA35-like N-terminal domain-containing protein n=1 Tax=Tritrichomonas foetus TaxID=1144522 RepID=A0A1J4KZN4_9EUKA|nr:hypothetical protein TRFO_14339 [Tritrichomonas foetus]|eukprot:OHT15166.1 hypothetical protein TRFO_14339 [Tritrichomonas foetus]
MEGDWTNIDLKVFSDCSSSLKYDEMIRNDLFNSKTAMQCLTCGSNRIDSHVIANGVHTINDYIAKGNSLPDENITHDEIRQIQGKLFDCTIAHFEGNNMYQTVLTCIYIHREYKIKNPLLKAVIDSFSYIVQIVEDFVKKYTSYPSYSWVSESGSIQLMHEKEDPLHVRKVLEDFKSKDSSLSDIVDFSIFLLDFSDYLQNFQTKPVPAVPALPAQSAPIGFSDVLHNRKLPTSSPPNLMQIESHEKSIEKFNYMMKIVNEIKDFPEIVTVTSLMDFLYEWATKHLDAPILPRFIVLAHIFPDEEKMQVLKYKSCKEFLMLELKKYHVNEKFFSFDDDKTSIETSIFSFLLYIGRALLNPIAAGHSVMTNQLLKYWGMLQQYLYATQMKSSRFMGFPKCDSDPMNKIIENPIMHWGIKISACFVNIYLKLGFLCGIYNSLDYMSIFLFMSTVQKKYAECYQKDRMLEAVYSAVSQMGKKKRTLASSNIMKRMGDESIQEIEHQILSNYLEFSIHMMQFALKTNSIKLPSNEFYNPAATFKSRKECIDLIGTIQFIEYDNFALLYDINNVQMPQIKSEITRKCNDTKALIKKLNDKGVSPDWIKDILKKCVMSSLSVVQWKEGCKYEVTIEDGLPNFTLIK